MGSRFGTRSPSFTVLRKNEGYEERKYPATAWVSTKLNDYSMKSAANMGFNRLLQYITGNNVDGQKIPMTVPVAKKVEPGPGPNCESAFTVSFYLDDDFQQSAPQPSDKNVFIDHWPPFECYVKSFGGFASDEKWVNAARDLADALPKDAPIKRDMYYTASYNSPFSVFNRTNEVWFVKNSDASTE